jgi:hypothetical protein
MVEVNQDISITAGDDFERVFTVTEGGSAKDLTGATPRWVAARSSGGTAIISSDDSDVSASVTAAASGEVTLTVDDTATVDLSGDYVHELEIESAPGEVVTVSRGVLSVDENTA